MGMDSGDVIFRGTNLGDTLVWAWFDEWDEGVRAMLPLDEDE